MIKMTEKTNWRHMAQIRKNWADGADLATQDVAEALVADIRANWGLGEAPNVDTGNLDSAIMVNPQGRDDSGRFAKGDDVTTRFVTANAPDGSSYHGRGNYSVPLEEGWSGPQGGAGAYPFLGPAIGRVQTQFPSAIRRRVMK